MLQISLTGNLSITIETRYIKKLVSHKCNVISRDALEF